MIVAIMMSVLIMCHDRAAPAIHVARRLHYCDMEIACDACQTPIQQCLNHVIHGSASCVIYVVIATFTWSMWIASVWHVDPMPVWILLQSTVGARMILQIVLAVMFDCITRNMPISYDPVDTNRWIASIATLSHDTCARSQYHHGLGTITMCHLSWCVS